MLSVELSRSGHTRRFVITSLQEFGWEMRVEHDEAILSQVRYTDWHRVERAFGRLEREVSTLQAEGWQEVRRSEAADVSR
jgi:hypothetical protein